MAGLRVSAAETGKEALVPPHLSAAHTCDTQGRQAGAATSGSGQEDNKGNWETITSNEMMSCWCWGSQRGAIHCWSQAPRPLSFCQPLPWGAWPALPCLSSSWGSWQAAPSAAGEPRGAQESPNLIPSPLFGLERTSFPPLDNEI